MQTLPQIPPRTVCMGVFRLEPVLSRTSTCISGLSQLLHLTRSLNSKVEDIWYRSSLRENLIAEALRYGTRCQGITQFYLPRPHVCVYPRTERNDQDLCRCIPTPPRRDRRLSKLANSDVILTLTESRKSTAGQFLPNKLAPRQPPTILSLTLLLHLTLTLTPTPTHSITKSFKENLGLSLAKRGRLHTSCSELRAAFSCVAWR